jgi:hypothetical protein
MRDRRRARLLLARTSARSICGGTCMSDHHRIWLDPPRSPAEGREREALSRRTRPRARKISHHILLRSTYTQPAYVLTSAITPPPTIPPAASSSACASLARSPLASGRPAARPGPAEFMATAVRRACHAVVWYHYVRPWRSDPSSSVAAHLYANLYVC